LQRPAINQNLLDKTRQIRFSSFAARLAGCHVLATAISVNNLTGGTEGCIQGSAHDASEEMTHHNVFIRELKNRGRNKKRVMRSRQELRMKRERKKNETISILKTEIMCSSETLESRFQPEYVSKMFSEVLISLLYS
jgi:hypothetical protein